MFKGKLFSEQIPAAEFLCNRKKVLLAWEQGTGKTIISLAAASKLFELGKVNKALVLCPSSFAWQWEDKLTEFTELEYSYVKREDKEAREYELESGVCILPYSLYRRDYEKIHKKEWDLVITDEAQEFSNPKSKTRKLLLNFNRLQGPTYRWALSGTAISNRLEELYSILYWVDKAYLPPWPEFEKRHIIRNSFGAIERYRNLDGLNLYLQKRVSRKTHKDMAGKLPKLLTKVHTLPQDKEYKEKERVLLKELDKVVDELTFTDSGEVQGLKRSPEASKAFHAVKQQLSKSKTTYCKELIQTILTDNPSSKIVVFSFYKDPLKQLAEELKKSNIINSSFTGDETLEQKRKAVDTFKNEGKVLLSSDAGAEGLDLPFADYAIQLDVPFSFRVWDQRNKRIVRASSKFSSVVVNYLLLEDSFESYFFEQVKRKGDLASAVLEGTNDDVVVKVQSLRQYLHSN